jgi:fatty acid-binding protein DegV
MWFVLHRFSDLSGTVASARTARSMHADADIRVIDMRTVPAV